MERRGKGDDEGEQGVRIKSDRSTVRSGEESRSKKHVARDEKYGNKRADR